MIFSPNAQVSNMMFRQSYIPLCGLGKEKQGHMQPMQGQPKYDRSGLGYQNL